MRLLRFFRPSHQHTAFSATLLLMAAITLSRVIGYIREAYIAYAFGAGQQTDAYVAAFTLPDWLNYIVAGGTASITFISIYTRFLAEKREQDAQKTFSIIITVMTTVLVAGTILAEIFTPQFAGWMFHGFTPEQMRLCVHLTRILLPAQIFFYVGGVVSAVLLSHRLFLLPAFGPLIYNVFIIAGGVVAGRQMGIASLAFGALAGSIAGPFLINAIGAAKIGTGYCPSFDVKNPAFREWVRLSIPLMLGVSLVTADDWILRYFASSGIGDIARLNYAKRLFAVPIAILGQATGQASLPFFSRLFGEKKFAEFAATVNASVYRITAASLLITGWMMAIAVPLIDLVYRRGHFTFADSESTALYFFWFSLSLALWSSQALYARAFYASGNTLTPMIATSLITLASLPIYALLFRTLSVTGLAIASDVGIAANALAIAALLHIRGMVSFAGLNWKELGKAALVGAVSGGLSYEVMRTISLDGSRRADLLALALGTVTWAAAVAAGLWLLRSELPAIFAGKNRLRFRAWPKAKPRKPWLPAKNRKTARVGSSYGTARRPREPAQAKSKGSSSETRKLRVAAQRCIRHSRFTLRDTAAISRTPKQNGPRKSPFFTVALSTALATAGSTLAPQSPVPASRSKHFFTSSGFEATAPPALRMSMPPLKNAPSSIEMRAATTSPVSEPSLRMSTRSLAVRLPRTLPSTTISLALMLAATTPLRPMVTRLPERLIDPSTLPSIYKDSEPVTSPLITSDLPIVAWSEVEGGGRNRTRHSTRARSCSS